MSRICLLLLALMFALGWSTPARASGDFGCTGGALRLNHANSSGCDDMAALGPGNDTRVNAAFLMYDLRGTHPRPGMPTDRQPPASLGPVFSWADLNAWLASAPHGLLVGSYATGEGSRCLSDEGGTTAFIAAATAARLPEAERGAIVAARQALHAGCGGTVDAAAVTAGLGQRVGSATGKAFVQYLTGAAAFYGGDFATAAARFAGLRGNGQPWLREAARYMVARVELNRAQVKAFDQYGAFSQPDGVDHAALAAAEAGLQAYLKDYPDGAYARSARGLVRRIYWLGGQRDRLAAEYAVLLAAPPGASGVSDADLLQEIDNKLLAGARPGETIDPSLLAVLDLRQLRSADDSFSQGCCNDVLTRDALQAQRPTFAANPALFDYLNAVRAFYIEKKPAEVLRLIPDAARQNGFTSLQFSRQMLRGMALEATGDRNARGFWMQMLPGTSFAAQRSALELAIALHDERAGALDRVFAADSPVQEPQIRQTLLRYVADAALLRRQASDPRASSDERQVALFVLLYKQLSRGAYRAFLGDVALIPAGAEKQVSGNPEALGVFRHTVNLGDFGCPVLDRTVRTLAGAPRDAHALLCLADFFRANDFDGSSLDTAPHKDELGGSPTRFAGAPYSRLEVYKAIIADPHAAGADKAYALFRAINCYAPSGNNTCGSDAPKAGRKAWFQRLHADYPTSRWAQESHYYW